MQDGPITTFLFTDIEGSTRLWEEEPERMRAALARHDAIARDAVEAQGGQLVKMTGDGVHAAFGDPLRGLDAALAIQLALEEPANTGGMALRVRCGLHAGVHEMRDGDFYGTAVNRAARIMGAAHGGQTLVSRTVADLLEGRLRDGVTLRDLGSARLRDVVRPERIFQVVHPRLRADFPPLRSLERTPNNLPNDVTTFVGREREIGEVRALLARHRLVTIAGMGGLGKSRLAVHVAAGEAERFADGVWLVELATLIDERRLEQSVGAAIGLREEPGSPFIGTLERFFAARQVLVVLDNCEHLLAGCARLAARLLRAAPGLCILATSREPLHAAGEASYPLSSLPVPSLRAPFEPGVLEQYDAVRLFVDRARAVQPGFEPSAANAAAIAAICHRLDGIPLALELAAARVRSLPVDKIAERLTYRFKLLKGADHTVLPRQQTLQALIDWSYDLLSEGERRLFRQLAVFAGSWTLEAAEAVCECGAEDVIDLLGRLVEKSLVEREAEPDRYWMLQTVREYALARLEESGEAALLRERHFAHFVALAEEAKPHLIGAAQGEWLARLDPELDNILAAHAHSLAGPVPPEQALSLVSSIKLYWGNRGLLDLGRRVILDALARAPGDGLEAPRCKALFDAGQLGCLMGDFAAARGHLEASLALARATGEDARVAAVLQPLGWAAVGEGDLDGGRRYLDEALAHARLMGNRREVASATNGLAQLDRLEGRLDAAEAGYRDVLQSAVELGDRETEAVALLNLAMVQIARHDTAGARTLEQAHAIVEETGSRRLRQSVLEVATGLAASRRQWREAALLYGCAQAQSHDTGIRPDQADAAFLEPWLREARAALGAERFDAAQREGRAMVPGAALDGTGVLAGAAPATYR
ncbi:MAG TPA: adenylate/guanylate cyclase domain-containing protein [Usitatibacter sp.]|nr:adenylate/guanylate cyclase domain-containing protein [Usitatibacter sp.]